MKLEFSTFESGLDHLNDGKTAMSNSSSQSVSISRTIQLHSSGSVMQSGSSVGIHSPISPSAAELDLKIASVKKVWENIPAMPTVLEHPINGGGNSEVDVSPTTIGRASPGHFNSFPGTVDGSTSSFGNTVNASGGSFVALEGGGPSIPGTSDASHVSGNGGGLAAVSEVAFR